MKKICILLVLCVAMNLAGCSSPNTIEDLSHDNEEIIFQENTMTDSQSEGNITTYDIDSFVNKKVQDIFDIYGTNYEVTTFNNRLAIEYQGCAYIFYFTDEYSDNYQAFYDSFNVKPNPDDVITGVHMTGSYDGIIIDDIRFKNATYGDISQKVNLINADTNYLWSYISKHQNYTISWTFIPGKSSNGLKACYDDSLIDVEVLYNESSYTKTLITNPNYDSSDYLQIIQGYWYRYNSNNGIDFISIQGNEYMCATYSGHTWSYGTIKDIVRNKDNSFDLTIYIPEVVYGYDVVSPESETTITISSPNSFKTSIYCSADSSDYTYVASSKEEFDKFANKHK